MTKAFERLLAAGSVDDHKLIEVDGAYCQPTAAAVAQAYRPDAIIRIGRHLYLNKQALTVDAPAWSLLFPEH